MNSTLFRIVTAVAALLLASQSASAQIVWNVNYSDSNGQGFNDTTILSGSLTVGQARRDSVTAALDYLSTVLDGRGTVNLNFGVSGTTTNNNTEPLASFGPQQYVDVTNSSLPGSFQNGGVYHSARTNTQVFDGSPDASGSFNFGYGWNYVGQTTNSNNYDMVTVAIHEIAHGAGFLSVIRSDGRGLFDDSTGQPNAYSGLDRHLQRGNGTGGSLFNTDITSSGYASFTGQVSTLTNGNDATTGLFFGGKYAREVSGGAVPMYAPSPFEPGSSLGHVVDTNAVMNPDITPNTVRRFQRYEIAMLLDIGWNVYNWDNATGNWNDGIGSNGSLDVTASNWRTDAGIVFINGSHYNIQSHQGQAPVLAPYGQVTSNLVLNFGGAAAYTATNDLGTLRLARLNLDSSATAASAIANAAASPDAELVFGVNSDGTASALAPAIRQDGAGDFAVSAHVRTTDTTSAPGGGWAGLDVAGSGAGRLTLSGRVAGTGGLTKAGAFTLELAGGQANTVAGATTVRAGTLVLNKAPGADAVGGTLVVEGGAVVLAAADQLPSAAGRSVVLAGVTLSTGDGLSLIHI